MLHTARPGSSTQRGCRQLGGFAMPGGPPTRQWSEPVDCGESQHEREACTQEQQVRATFLPTHGPYHAFEAPNNGYARACAGPPHALCAGATMQAGLIINHHVNRTLPCHDATDRRIVNNKRGLSASS